MLGVLVGGQELGGGGCGVIFVVRLRLVLEPDRRRRRRRRLWDVEGRRRLRKSA